MATAATLTAATLPTVCSFILTQTEDLAALTAQQYYVEVGDRMIPERLARMIPSVIPDSLLAGPGTHDKWMQMVVASFNRVSSQEDGFLGSCEKGATQSIFI